MSLSWIENQPIKFTEYGSSDSDDCCYHNDFGIGGRYLAKAKHTDNFSAQLEIGVCGDETQLFTNPDFTSGSDGFDGWTTFYFPLSSPPYVSDEVAYLPYISGVSQGGFTAYEWYIVQVNILNDTTVLVSGATGSNVFLEGSGFQTAIVQAGAAGVISIQGYTNGTSSQISVAYAYASIGISDITAEIFASNSDPSTATPAATLTTQNLTLTSNILSINFTWDSFSLDDGCYFVSLSYDCDSETIYFVSNDFSISNSWCGTKRIFGCIGQDAFGFSNATFFPSLRIEAQLAQSDYDAVRYLTRNTAGLTRNYYSNISKLKTLETEYLPPHVQDWMGSLLGYNNIEIGGKNWSISDDRLTTEENPIYPEWALMEIRLQQNNTPLIRALCNETVPCSEPPPNCMLWNDGQDIDWNDNECIEWNN